VSAFRIKFTLHGDIGLFTSPPSDSFELALRRAEDLQRPDISAQRLLDSWHDDDPGMRMVADRQRLQADFHGVETAQENVRTALRPISKG
jgi:hypothetical protein